MIKDLRDELKQMDSLDSDTRGTMLHSLALRSVSGDIAGIIKTEADEYVVRRTLDMLVIARDDIPETLDDLYPLLLEILKSPDRPDDQAMSACVALVGRFNRLHPQEIAEIVRLKPQLQLKLNQCILEEHRDYNLSAEDAFAFIRILITNIDSRDDYFARFVLGNFWVWAPISASLATVIRESDAEPALKLLAEIASQKPDAVLPTSYFADQCQYRSPGCKRILAYYGKRHKHNPADLTDGQ